MTLKKDGIRAVMSEAAERETLKGMGQRTNPGSKEVGLASPRWTVVYNIVSPESDTWVGTGWEFFDNEREADMCYRRHQAAGNVPTKRQFYDSVDALHLGIADQKQVTADSAGAMVETGWLLEKTHNGQVWYVTANSMLEWTDDPNKALRLARREDAEALCTIVEDADKIASHEWVPAPPAPLVSDCDPDG